MLEPTVVGVEPKDTRVDQIDVASTFDYWTHEGDLGTAAQWVFEGQDGLDRLSGLEVLTAPAPNRFRARMTRVQLDHVAIEAFQASAHRSERTRRLVEVRPADVLTFVLVSEGVLQLELEGGSLRLGAGEAAVIDGREPMVQSTEGDVRMLRSVIGIEYVPEALQRPHATVPEVLERTPLTDSFIGFISSILRTAVQGRPARGQQLIQAVADLQCAVLAEAQHAAQPKAGSTGLRYRMEEYIEEHYMDADIDPGSVAQAVGISLRHAHAVFDDGERTIARVIRDRRISAVARELRTRPEPSRFTYLAERYGFGSADTLGRAFRQRFGMTLSEYRSGGHRSLG